ncbi:hypothetical protein ACQCVB_17770 [Fictibacillus phosphorivorans]|uniref:hypothetical protein n=1 Tax=Fictibacillus phosphorivorans TaxID=1221500 RepID=UPI003CEB967E
MNKFRALPPKARLALLEKMDNAVVVDSTTGEVIENATVKPNFSGSAPQQAQFAKRADEMAKYNEEQDGFIFTFYKLAEHIGKELTKQDLARLLFLPTHLTYSNILKFDNGVEITKKNMPELLGLGAKAFRSFYNTLIELGVMEDKKDYIKLNEDYFYKGSLPQALAGQEIAYTRTYVKGIRELYKEYGTTRKAGQLGLLYIVIPYIHKETNILATNTDEKERRFINALSLQEVAEILGYTADKITTALTSVVLGNEYVFMVTQIGKEKNVVVNPKVLWRGKTAPSETVLALFEMKSKKK